MKADNKLITVKMLKETLTQAFSDFGHRFGREMRDFMRQELTASETRIKTELRAEMKELKTEILEGVGDIIDNGIHPQLDNHEERIFKLETRIQH